MKIGDKVSVQSGKKTLEGEIYKIEEGKLYKYVLILKTGDYYSIWHVNDGEFNLL